MVRFAALSTERKEAVRLWLLLVVGFLVVGASVGFSLASQTLDRFWADCRRDLITSAELVAQNVDGDQFDQLTDPVQQGGDTYTKISDRLAEAKRSLPGAKYLYTLRSVNQKVYFVVDPTPAGDADKDGVEDKSNLMDPYEEASPLLKKVLDSGEAAAEEQVTVDRWGSFISAYAPVKNSKGRVVGAVGIDLDARSVLEHISNIERMGMWGFLLALVLGGGYSAIIVSKISRREYNPLAAKYSRFGKSGRAMILEFVVVSFVVSILGVGAFALQTRSRIETEVSGYEASFTSIREVRSLILQAYADRYNQDLVSRCRRSMTKAGFTDLTEHMPASGRSLSWLSVNKVLEALDERERSLVMLKDHSRHRADEADQVTTIAFGVAAFMVLISLALLRAVIRQHQDLLTSKAITEKQKADFEEMVSNLPIGFFTFSSEGIIFTNPAWDRLVGRGPDETSEEALVRSLGATNGESEDLIQICKVASQCIEPFATQFTVRNSKSVRIIQAQGVPVRDEDDRLDYMLGFFLDVTQREFARRELEQKHVELGHVNQSLQRAVEDLSANFEGMVQALVKAVEAKDLYTAGHSERVMNYSVSIGVAYGLTAAELRTLQMGALIHDIGKIGIPDETLTKPSGLTDVEYRVIKTHPEIGARMVEGIPAFQECVPIVLLHHERLDGRGYPFGLMGDEIPILVRIAAIADSYDAMTSNRAYRNARTADVAIEELRKDAMNGALDPELVEIFANIIESQGLDVSLDQDIAA